MSYPGTVPISDHYKHTVSRLVRQCMDGEIRYKDAARAHSPIVVLLTYMQREVISQVELARRLGVHQPIVSKMLSGKLVPESQLRQRIEAVCSIPVESWDRAWKAA